MLERDNMAWPTNPRLAKSLVVFREQIDKLYPNRNKASDGALGDTLHASTGAASDHNPWFNDANGVGVVTAIDITHDPRQGCDCNKIAEALRQSRDPRIKYVIFNSRTYDPGDGFGWEWQDYSGDNPHDKHMHVSVNINNYDDTQPWVIGEQEVTTQGLVESLYRELLGRPDKDGHPLLDEAAKAYIGQPFDKVYDAVVNSSERKKYLETQKKKLDDATVIASIRDTYLKEISKAVGFDVATIDKLQLDKIVTAIKAMQDDGPIAEARDKYLKIIAKAQGFDFKIIEEPQIKQMEAKAKLNDNNAQIKLQRIQSIIEEKDRDGN